MLTICLFASSSWIWTSHTTLLITKINYCLLLTKTVSKSNMLAQTMSIEKVIILQILWTDYHCLICQNYQSFLVSISLLITSWQVKMFEKYSNHASVKIFYAPTSPNVKFPEYINKNYVLIKKNSLGWIFMNEPQRLIEAWLS